LPSGSYIRPASGLAPSFGKFHRDALTGLDCELDPAVPATARVPLSQHADSISQLAFIGLETALSAGAPHAFYKIAAALRP
jgi:hypothetical protein